LSEIHSLTYTRQVFPLAKPLFIGVGVLLSVRILLKYPPGQYTNAYISQTAKDVRGSQDTLVDVFERIESFIRRLEVYAGVRPTAEMMNAIVQILVEVISILGIATKEIKEGLISE
jgi:hypothetical protein